MLNDNIPSKRVAFYIRVSTDEQEKKWYWIEYQTDELKKLIEFKSSQVPSWTHNKKHRYIDGACSWGDLNRAGFKKMMEDAKKWEFDIVAVWKIDRMSRNLTHLLKVFEDLRNHNVFFFSLKENIDFSGPVWRLTFQIFWALAEFEREMIKTRTMEWKIASAKRWNYTWNAIPYWFDRDTSWAKWVKLKVVEREAKVIQDIFRWYTYDGWHFAKISNKLNELWVEKWVASKSQFKKSKWRQEMIKFILQNTIYTWKQTRTFKRDDWEVELIENNNIPAIIDEDTFDYTQLKIKQWEENWSVSKNGGWKNQYLLSRKIFDSATKKWCIWYTRQDGSYWYRRKWYTDSEWVWHKNMEITWDELDDFVWKHISQLISDPEDFYKLFQIEENNENDSQQLKTYIQDLNNRIKEKEEARDNIEESYSYWRIWDDRRDRLVEKNTTEIENIEKEILETQKTLHNLTKVKYTKEALKKVSEKYKKNMSNLSLEHKQLIIDVLVDNIIATELPDWTKRCAINFKFDLTSKQKELVMDEYKNSTSTSKSKGAKYASCINGEASGARTQDLLLKRELLYRLS